MALKNLVFKSQEKPETQTTSVPEVETDSQPEVNPDIPKAVPSATETAKHHDGNRIGHLAKQKRITDWRRVDPKTDSDRSEQAVRTLEKEIRAYPRTNPDDEYKRRLIMQVNYIRKMRAQGVELTWENLTMWPRAEMNAWYDPASSTASGGDS